MPKILIVGGGYAGFYAAWKLEKQLRRGEAELILVDPLPYMTYQPFLPEVAAGSIEPRHAVVAHRRHLKDTEVITAKVTYINHAEKKATVQPEVGEAYELEYDTVIITAGAVSRTFPIPGVADEAVGVKTIEEAVFIRDRLLSNFDKAAALPHGDPRRERLLTVAVVGGGFAGIEIFAELRSFASYLLRRYPQIDFDETHFHLIEAAHRIMPEVSEATAQWVIDNLSQRGADVHLDTQLSNAEGGHLELSNGTTLDTDLLIWTAGVMATPAITKHTDLPIEGRGRLTANATLQVVGEDGEIIEGAWTAGDIAAVPDLTGGGVGGFCVPNAQHAVRQAKRLAKNVLAVERGEKPIEYVHKNLGAVAGLGLYIGAFQSGKTSFKGFIAWCAHRGYHGLAMPSWERKWRVIWGWVLNFFLGRDIVALPGLATPRAAFEEFASRPRTPSPVAIAPPGPGNSGSVSSSSETPDAKSPGSGSPGASDTGTVADLTATTEAESPVAPEQANKPVSPSENAPDPA